jgi:hypothetical protein
MRYLYAFLSLVMILFAVVQYNDPDGPIWALIYGIPAAWAGVAAFRPDLLAGPRSRALLALSAVAAIGLTIWLWPTAPGWWRQEVWWDSEASREGMGLMIATAVVLAVLLASLFRCPKGFLHSR